MHDIRSVDEITLPLSSFIKERVVSEGWKIRVYIDLLGLFTLPAIVSLQKKG